METRDRPHAADNVALHALPSAEPMRPNLRRIALAAVASNVLSAEAPENETADISFLREHLVFAHDGPGGWRSTLRHYLRQPHEDDLPLLRLTSTLGLSRIEMLGVALAAAVEDEIMIGRAIARLQAPMGGSRPMVGLIVASFADATPRDTRAIDMLLTGPAVSSGLITVLGGDVPMPERSIAVAQHICHALHGRDGTLAGTTIGIGDAQRVPLPSSIVLEAQRHARGLASAAGHALVIRSRSLAEGRAAAAAVAEALGKRPLFIETEKTPALAPWLVLRGLVPVYHLDPAPGERKTVPTHTPQVSPAIVVSGPDGAIESPHGSAMTWTLPVPPRDEREQLWASALGGGDEALVTRLAREYRHGSGRIAQLGRLVRHHMASDDREAPSMDDVAAAAWIAEGNGLDALAQPLPELIPDDALVLTPALRREIDALLARCRARDGLVAGLGASAVTRYHPGVRALFVGASGTGKTLAAGWLATRLALPLYRVDLASITSKYIGETEKNLAQLLARAEQAEVILLFDEADSLFGKRTDVKDSNDRFANAQTNYLLQRIESYDGITLLTSNSRARFDSAFSRRLDVIIEFPLPGPDERRALWLSHLGPDHQLETREVNQLSARVDLAGGHIRNAVLTAAVAAHEAKRSVSYSDVLEGVASEYRKLGRQVPVELHVAH
jgi:hypothetical protein